LSFSKDDKPTGYSIDLCQEIVSLEKQLDIDDIKTEWRAGNTPEP